MVAIVVTAALALRAAILWLSYGKVPAGDPYNYLILSNSLVSGHGFTMFDPTLDMTVRAMCPPLYPVLLALAGGTQLSAFFLNVAIDLAAAGAMLWLGSLLGEKAAGRFAAAIYLVWPVNVLSSAAPQKEGLIALLAILSAALLLKRKAALLGVTIGLLAITQPALVPLPCLFAVVLRRWMVLLLAIPLAIAVVVPWWIRNYLVFGTFVPLTTAAGWSLWIGVFGPDGSWVPLPQRMLQGDELAVSRIAFLEAWIWISNHPFGYLVHCLEKLIKSLLGVGWNLDRLLQTANLPVTIFKLPIQLLSLAVDVFAITAAVTYRNSFGALLAMGVLQLLLFQMWFEMAERHSNFLVPFLLLVAGSAIFRNRDWQSESPGG